MLRGLTPVTDPRFVASVGDDAAVWRNGEGYLAATVDFFTPIVDDARTWGRIAAANAASDIYAMGGTPVVALNLAAWPKELDLDLLADVLAGAEETARQGGWIVAGGHTIEGPEPLFGQSVTGVIEAGHLRTNAGARAGEAIVIGKAVGTGAVATAVKRMTPDAVAPGGALHASYGAAVGSMVMLNGEAARIAREVGASACTDVTGFGLLGHLGTLLRASGLAATVDFDAVPLLPGAVELIREGNVPGGTGRNLEAAGALLEVAPERSEADLAVLADPQTSGGLLFTCDADRAAGAVASLGAAGYAAAIVGETAEGEAGTISVR